MATLFNCVPLLLSSSEICSENPTLDAPNCMAVNRMEMSRNEPEYHGAATSR